MTVGKCSVSASAASYQLEHGWELGQKRAQTRMKKSFEKLKTGHLLVSVTTVEAKRGERQELAQRAML